MGSKMNGHEDQYLRDRAVVLSEQIIRIAGVGDNYCYGAVRIDLAEGQYPPRKMYRAQFRAIAEFDEWGGKPITGPAAHFNPSSSTIFITADLSREELKIGPGGAIAMSHGFQNRGIGSYLLAKVLAWAVMNYPTFRVLEGSLSANQGQVADDRLRRNNFYRKQGLTLKFSDSIEASGRFYADAAEQLTPNWNPAKITEISLDELVQELRAATQEAVGLKRQIEASKSAVSRLDNDLKARSHWNVALLVTATILGLMILSGGWGGFVSHIRSLL